VGRIRAKRFIWVLGILFIFLVSNPCVGQKRIKMRHIRKMEKERNVTQLMEIMDKSRFRMYYKEKIEAVKALERLGDPQALPVLLDIVKSGKFSYRKRDSTKLVGSTFRSILTFKNPEAVITILGEKEKVPPYYFERGWNALISMNLSETHYQSMAVILGEKIPPHVLSRDEIQIAEMGLNLIQLIPNQYKVEPLIFILNAGSNVSNEDTKKLKENAAQQMSEILLANSEAMAKLMTFALNHSNPRVMKRAIKLIGDQFDNQEHRLHVKFKQTLQAIQSNKTLYVSVKYVPGNLTVNYDENGNPQQAVQLQKVPAFQTCFEDTLKSYGFQIATEAEADYILQFQFRESNWGGSGYGRSQIASYYNFTLKMEEEQTWDTGWDGPYLKILRPSKISRMLINDLNVYLVIRKLLEKDTLEN
jgi:hypothetical protein